MSVATPQLHQFSSLRNYIGSLCEILSIICLQFELSMCLVFHLLYAVVVVVVL